MGSFLSEKERQKQMNFSKRPDPRSGINEDEPVQRPMARSGGKDGESTWSRLRKTMLKLKKGKGGRPKVPMML